MKPSWVREETRYPNFSAAPQFPRDAGQEGAHTRPFLLARAEAGGGEVWTDSKVQCTFASLGTSQREAKGRLGARVAVGSPTQIWVAGCECLLARVRDRWYPCPRRDVSSRASRGHCQPRGGGAGAGEGRGPGFGPPREPAPSEPGAQQWDVFSFKS